MEEGFPRLILYLLTRKGTFDIVSEMLRSKKVLPTRGLTLVLVTLLFVSLMVTNSVRFSVRTE